MTSPADEPGWWPPAIVPTVRCATLLGALALAALILPAWISLAAVLVLIAATLQDARSVRRAPRVQRSVAALASRGVPIAFSVRALTPDGRRVLLRQPAPAGVRVSVRGGLRELDGVLVAERRGRHELPGVACASVGPLGLARFHHAPGATAQLLVYPDVLGARRLALALRRGATIGDGRPRPGPVGLGTEFESVRDYTSDDDVRQINWSATARLGRPMSNQYRIERERDVLCVVDAGRLMAAALGSGTILDAALDAVAAVALAADEVGDRCGAIAFDAAIRRSQMPRKLGGRRVIDALYDLQPSALDSDFERAFVGVGGLRRACVIVFTDLIDESAARSLIGAAPMLAGRHSLLVASVSDPLIDSVARRAPQNLDDVYEQLAALTVVQARAAAARQIARAGAHLIAAPAQALPRRCVSAYLGALDHGTVVRAGRPRRVG